MKLTKDQLLLMERLIDMEVNEVENDVNPDQEYWTELHDIKSVISAELSVKETK